MQRITIKDDEKFLRNISSEIDFLNDDYLTIINSLKNYCRNNKVYALAPVQIGIPKRIIYIKNTSENMDNNIDKNHDEEIVLINPKILNRKGIIVFSERCESCLDYVGIVKRPYETTIEYYDADKNKHIQTFNGFKSIVFNHEYDHLNGILHLDRTKDILKMTWEETRDYRKNNPAYVVSYDSVYIDEVDKNNFKKYKQKN